MAIKKATQLVDVGWKRTATHFPHEFQWKKKEKRTTITFNEDAWPKKKEKRNNNKVRLGSLISCNYQTRWRLYERRISVRSLGPPPPHLPLLFISRFRRVLFFVSAVEKILFRAVLLHSVFFTTVQVCSFIVSWPIRSFMACQRRSRCFFLRKKNWRKPFEK